MTDDQFKEFVKLVVKHDEDSNGHYYIRMPKWFLPVITAIVSALVTFGYSQVVTNTKHEQTLEEHTRLLDYHTRMLDQIQVDIRNLLSNESNREERSKRR